MNSAADWWKNHCIRCCEKPADHPTATCAQFVKPKAPFGRADVEDMLRERNRNPAPGRASLEHGDRLPPGPYTVSTTRGPSGRPERPYTILAGNGQCVAGHVESIDCAEAIALALNEVFSA